MENVQAVEEEEDSEENDFSEVAEYSPKSEFSKPSLVFQAMQTCIKLRAEEMRPGYFNTKLTKEGQAIRIWVPDARQKYIGSVDALISILNPEIERSKRFKTQALAIQKESEQIFKRHEYVEVIPNFINGSFKWIQSGRKYIPAIDSSIKRPHPKLDHKILYIPGYWNSHTNEYFDEMVEVYDQWLALLNNLIDELNYFKQAISF